jgi:hypothetical protein
MSSSMMTGVQFQVFGSKFTEFCSCFDVEGYQKVKWMLPQDLIALFNRWACDGTETKLCFPSVQQHVSCGGHVAGTSELYKSESGLIVR